MARTFGVCQLAPQPPEGVGDDAGTVESQAVVLDDLGPYRQPLDELGRVANRLDAG